MAARGGRPGGGGRCLARPGPAGRGRQVRSGAAGRGRPQLGPRAVRCRGGGGAEPAEREAVARGEGVFSGPPGLVGFPHFCALSRILPNVFFCCVVLWVFFSFPSCSFTTFASNLRTSRKPQAFCWASESRGRTADAGCCQGVCSWKQPRGRPSALSVLKPNCFWSVRFWTWRG